MPEVLGAPPGLRTALFWNGTAWQWALVDAAGHLQLDVLSNANLDTALQSLATDRLIVRGENQLFSYREELHDTVTTAVSGAGGYIESNTPAVGDVWVVTTAMARDITSPTTHTRIMTLVGAVGYEFRDEMRAIAADERVIWAGMVIIERPNVIRANFTGSLAGDTCVLALNGWIMDAE